MDKRSEHDASVGVRAAVSAAAGGRIVRDPRVLGGEPTVKGTRVPVRAILLNYRRDPSTRSICAALPMLTPEDVRAALDFYQANRAEIDRLIVENELDSVD